MFLEKWIFSTEMVVQESFLVVLLKFTAIGILHFLIKLGIIVTAEIYIYPNSISLFHYTIK